MKKSTLCRIHLMVAFFFCVSTLSAQNRIQKHYSTAEFGEPIQPTKRSKPVFQSIQTLSGYYFQGFESAMFPPAGWQVVDVIDTSNGWSSSLYADYPAPYEGGQSAYCRYANPGPIGEDWLITPKFSVAGGDSLTFQMRWESRGWHYDSTFIVISTTDSAIESFSHRVGLYVDTATIQVLNVPDWYYKTISLQAFAGQDIYVAFVNKNSNGDGIYIDNVELGSRPEKEVGTVSIGIDAFTAVGPSSPKVSFKNKGSQAQTFSATLKIGSDYTQTINLTLLPQQTQVAVFPTWNATLGSYPIRAFAMLNGDANPMNDTLSSETRVLEVFENYGWSQKEPLSVPTFGACAVSVTPVTNPRLFLLGGNVEQAIVKKVYQFDVGFDTWSESTSMPKEAMYASAASGNGKIFIFGGRVTSGTQGRTQIFNYETETWTVGAPMPTPVFSAAHVTYKDSLVYFFGGYDDALGEASPLTQVYNLYTNTWTTGTPRPGTPVYTSRAGIIGNKIVLAGGVELISTKVVDTTYVGVINPTNPTQIMWTQVEGHPAGAIARCGTGTSALVGSNLVVFAGGSDEFDIFSTTNRTFAFDLSTNTWKLGPNKPVKTNLFQMASIVKNDSVYLAALGGIENLIQDSNGNEWLNMGPYTGPTAVMSSVSESGFELFPNPASESIRIRLSTEQLTSKPQVLIYNLNGLLIRQYSEINPNKGTTLYLKTDDLPPGLYSVKVSSESKTQSKRFVKH